MERAAEEEMHCNDYNKEEEEEERQHDEKHEDVKKEAEEERKCLARNVYLGHLCLPSLPSSSCSLLPPFLSLNPPSPHIVHSLASAVCCLFQCTSADVDANG